MTMTEAVPIPWYVYVLPAPPYVESSTVPIHEFVQEWSSAHIAERVLSAMREVVQHPQCDRDSLLPGRVGLAITTGNPYFIWVDVSTDTAFVVSGEPIPFITACVASPSPTRLDAGS